MDQQVSNGESLMADQAYRLQPDLQEIPRSLSKESFVACAAISRSMSDTSSRRRLTSSSAKNPLIRSQQADRNGHDIN